MLVLINKGGRIVEFSDENEYKSALSRGFTKPTDDELKSYQQLRIAKVQQIKNPIIKDSSVYMATVTAGGADGYGVSSKKLLAEFKKIGVNISTSNKGQKIGMLFHAPYSLLRMDNQFRIVYTMFESDKIPDDWVAYLKASDRVYVPSNWCKEVFKKSGIDAEVIPLGYDDNVFVYKPKTNKRKDRKDFVFLHYNAYNIRKGFPEVLQAFEKAFDPSEPVKLILKTTLDTVPLPLPPSQYPKIEVRTGAISDVELAELCQNSDCFVFPSRGEGFGITPLEAMACGTPAIVPNAHGISEYFNSEYMYEVKVKETCPGLYSRYKGQDVGKMVVCDVDDLAKKMRYVYEHQDEAIDKGAKASEYVKQWTFANTAKMFKEVFNELGNLPAPKRQLNDLISLEAV